MKLFLIKTYNNNNNNNKDHATTRLIITDAHEKLGHGTGVEHLLCELQYVGDIGLSKEDAQ